MTTYVRVTYVAMVPDGCKPIVTAHTFEDLKAGVNEYYGIAPNNPDAEFIGFEPYITKYPDEYEGDLVYSVDKTFAEEPCIERVKVYCTEFHPHTIYEVNEETK